MTERNPHPDNDFIAELTEDGGAGGQGSGSRGNLRANVGTRAELERALDGEDGTTAVTGSDNPSQDAMKGAKTSDAIRNGNQG